VEECKWKVADLAFAFHLKRGFATEFFSRVRGVHVASENSLAIEEHVLQRAVEVVLGVDFAVRDEHSACDVVSAEQRC
jgi:hypothetical protein